MIINVHYLLVFQVVVEPVPQGLRRLSVSARNKSTLVLLRQRNKPFAIKPEVHEPKSPDVRAVRVVDQSIDLLARELERAQLEEEAVGGGDDAAGADAADAAAHARLTGGLARS